MDPSIHSEADGSGDGDALADGEALSAARQMESDEEKQPFQWASAQKKSHHNDTETKQS